MAGIDSFFIEPYEHHEDIYTPCFQYTMHPHSKQSYLDESVPLSQVLKFTRDVDIQQNAFSGQPGIDIEQQLPEADSCGGEKRNNNTVFKTPLSQFRKSLMDVLKRAPDLQFLRKEMQAVCVTKNQSVFPKWLSMVRALHIQNEVLKSWIPRKQKLIQKKKEHLKEGKYTQKRLAELEKNVTMMDESLRQPNLQKSFDIYWGKYKQHQKYQKCKKEVKSFDDGFRNKFAKDERFIRSKAFQTQKSCKRLKTIKIQKKSKRGSRKE